MSCRHDLANGTCIRCYPSNPYGRTAHARVDPGPEEDYEPNLEGPGAAIAADLQIAKDDAVRVLLDALAMPSGRSVRKAWDDVTLLYGRFGSVLMRAAFEQYLDELAVG